MRHGKYPFIIGFLVVPVALYVTFVVAAYLQTFQLALTDWSGLTVTTRLPFRRSRSEIRMGDTSRDGWPTTPERVDRSLTVPVRTAICVDLM